MRLTHIPASCLLLSWLVSHPEVTVSLLLFLLCKQVRVMQSKTVRQLCLQLCLKLTAALAHSRPQLMLDE